MTPCLVCHEPTTETVPDGGFDRPKHSSREGCVAALRERVEKMESDVIDGMLVFPGDPKTLADVIDWLRGTRWAWKDLPSPFRALLQPTQVAP